MQFASVNDVVMHYDFQPIAAEKPVLVFINSLGTDFRIWDEVRARLRNDVSTLVYDKRGHGLSDVGATPTQSNSLRPTSSTCSTSFR